MFYMADEPFIRVRRPWISTIACYMSDLLAIVALAGIRGTCICVGHGLRVFRILVTVFRFVALVITKFAWTLKIFVAAVVAVASVDPLRSVRVKRSSPVIIIIIIIIIIIVPSLVVIIIIIIRILSVLVWVSLSTIGLNSSITCCSVRCF